MPAELLLGYQPIGLVWNPIKEGKQLQCQEIRDQVYAKNFGQGQSMLVAFRSDWDHWSCFVYGETSRRSYHLRHQDHLRIRKNNIFTHVNLSPWRKNRSSHCLKFWTVSAPEQTEGLASSDSDSVPQNHYSYWDCDTNPSQGSHIAYILEGAVCGSAPIHSGQFKLYVPDSEACLQVLFISVSWGKLTAYRNAISWASGMSMWLPLTSVVRLRYGSSMSLHVCEVVILTAGYISLNPSARTPRHAVRTDLPTSVLAGSPNETGPPWQSINTALSLILIGTHFCVSPSCHVQ